MEPSGPDRSNRTTYNRWVPHQRVQVVRPATVREGSQARPTAADSRSAPVGVHAFESHPSHCETRPQEASRENGEGAVNRVPRGRPPVRKTTRSGLPSHPSRRDAGCFSIESVPTVESLTYARRAVPSGRTRPSRRMFRRDSTPLISSSASFTAALARHCGDGIGETRKRQAESSGWTARQPSGRKRVQR